MELDLAPDCLSAGKKHRIGVDFHVFDGKFQGSRSHLLGIFSELIDLLPDCQFYFFLEKVEQLKSLPAFQRPNVQLVFMPHANPLVRLAWLLPRLRHRYQLDILHTQYVIPFWPAQGNAVTIHDVLFEPFPQFFSRIFVFRSRLMMRWAARKADLLFTVSDYSRQEIAERYGVDAGRISVLHNAVDTDRFFPGDAGLEFLQDRGLASRNYLLTVGRIEPRKNHAAILRAYALMGDSPPPLVIIGQRDFGYGDFEVALAEMPASHRVIVFDDVGDDELPALYRHAKAFVYPSFAEGFGMPPLEGMASGTPVITSSTTAIPEVVGNAALLIDPVDVKGLQLALGNVNADSVLRNDLIGAGLLRASAFSWQKSAEVLALAYQNYFQRESR